METNPLGQYLRARRERVQPEDVGLPRMAGRRVPGLRREELGMLAGISADYYLRLEQGKNLHPSAQVLNALARALLLDEDATAHLHALAAPRPLRRSAHRRERVPLGIAQLLGTLDRTPAFVQGRFMDVLAANKLATALSPNFTVGRNLLASAFLDPREQELHLDWEATTEDVVAGLRAALGSDLSDPHLVELVGMLSLRSDRFRQLWARHDVRPKIGKKRLLRHPQLGEIELRYEKLAIAGTAGQVLVIYHSEPGSPSEDSLALLTSLATTQPEQEDAIKQEPEHPAPAT